MQGLIEISVYVNKAIAFNNLCEISSNQSKVVRERWDNWSGKQGY